jgi:cystathionine beta-lyase
LQACTAPFIALASAGSHVLVGDNIYGPTRRFCDRTLKRWGCETEFFDTTIGDGIASLIRPNTRLIFLESPGSMTFETADAPAIARVASAAGVATAMDNTWSAGVFHKPLSMGFDLSIQANTKYVSGGADVLSGAILTNREDLIARIKESIADLGLNVAPDDAYLVLRGLRTLPARMERHQASAIEVARWLGQRPEVQRVLYPALEADSGHELWKRDFSGASGVFSFVLQASPLKQVNAFLDALNLFGLGFSYGGFESLAIYCDPQLKRTAARPRLGGPLIRLSIGLEDPADLIADLEQAFGALA